MSDPNRANIKEIAAALSVPERTARHRAFKAAWSFEEEILPTGAKRRLYPLATLPKDIYDALIRHRSGCSQPIAIDPAYQPTAAEIRVKAAQTMTPEAQRRMDAKLEIVSALRRFTPEGAKREETRERFAVLYNSRQADVPEWVFETRPHVCRNSLINWEREIAEGELAKLGGRHKGRAGDGTFDLHSGLRDLAIGMFTKNPLLSIAAVRGVARAEYGDRIEIVDEESGEIRERSLPTVRSFQRFVERYKADHPALLAKACDPDLYRSKYEYAAGKMYTDIVRRNQLWEADASPCDVLCVDGRYSIYVVIDVHSRWPRVRVTRTPRSSAILLLIRDCILGWPGRPETAWGVPEVLKTDNGSDFTSVHFKDVIRRIGIDQRLCAPYSPKQKACVERMIGTIQHVFMPLQPGYVGASVADRKTIEARKAFAQRLGQDDRDAFRVELTAAELQSRLNDWVEHVYVNEPHDGLGGKTPFMTRASYRGRLSQIQGEGALETLLAAPPKGDGTRVVTSKGVSVDNIDYYNGNPMPGEMVHVRLDPDDLGRIYVYRGDPWEFAGVAINPERAGVSRAEVAAKVKAEQKAVLDEGMKGIRAAQRSINSASVGLSVIDAAKRRNGSVTPFPSRFEPHVTPDLEATENAASVGKRLPKQKLTKAQEARREAMVAEFVRPPDPPPPDPRTSRLERAGRIAAGEVVDADEAAWLNRYRSTPEYRAAAMLAAP